MLNWQSSAIDVREKNFVLVENSSLLEGRRRVSVRAHTFPDPGLLAKDIFRKAARMRCQSPSNSRMVFKIVTWNTQHRPFSRVATEMAANFAGSLLR